MSPADPGPLGDAVMTHAEPLPGPLAGFRVLDLSRYIAGPYCGLLLADMGAEVVKVERPAGEDARTLLPRVGDLSTYFIAYNRNKKGITLNLRHPKGPELLRRLVTHADVLVENFRPGVMASLRCDYDRLQQVNARLVMVSVSGFGQDGPHAGRPAFDAIAQAMGGLMSITGLRGGPPMLAGAFVGDYSAALYAAFGAVTALLHRVRTGRGRHVDVAILDSVFSLLMTAVPDYLTFGRTMGPVGSRDRYRSPANVYATRDGFVYIIAVTQPQFAALARAMGHPELLEDARFRDQDARLDHAEELDAAIMQWARARTAEEVVQTLTAASVPCAPVATVAEVVKNPQLRHRGQIMSIDHPGLDGVALPASPVRLSDMRSDIAHPAPLIGEHNAEIYGAWLGLSSEEIASLQTEEII